MRLCRLARPPCGCASGINGFGVALLYGCSIAQGFNEALTVLHMPRLLFFIAWWMFPRNFFRLWILVRSSVGKGAKLLQIVARDFYLYKGFSIVGIDCPGHGHRSKGVETDCHGHSNRFAVATAIDFSTLRSIAVATAIDSNKENSIFGTL